MGYSKDLGFSEEEEDEEEEEEELEEEEERLLFMGAASNRLVMMNHSNSSNNNNHSSSSPSGRGSSAAMEQQQQQNYHSHQQQIPYGGMMLHHHQESSPSTSAAAAANFMSKEGVAAGGAGGAYDLGELDQALLLYLDGGHNNHDPCNSSLHHHPQDHNQRLQQHQHGNHQSAAAAAAAGGGGMSSNTNRPPTLNIFPSQPMHSLLHPSPKTNTATTAPLHHHQQQHLPAAATSGSKRPSADSMDHLAAATRNPHAAAPLASAPPTSEPPKSIKREGNRKGPITASNSEHEGPKTPDPKTLRRLAQNREAARKSRLRKKAYVQQLESSRIKLTQLEQELQRARSQGMFFSGGGLLGGDQNLHVISNISTDAAVFDMEYTRWLEEHHRLTCELRAAVQEHLPENELRMYVDNCLAHYDVVMNLKGMVAKTDVFHLVSGMWKTPAERCFLWMGGFRPSELIKIIVSQIEPLTEQQILGICGLQQSTQEAEEALSQGLDSLNQSLSETITSDSLSSPPNMANYMGQMAMAMNKLSTLEGFVRQVFPPS
ncbi:unnamed protein product [Linum tenue]|uniref:Uncharacterized protein n=1 Tax=Linum tenue TaxID=586396 RepID=A0AAV0MLF6_9ROSI|nr:unnamed protein product [Linum tenue]